MVEGIWVTLETMDGATISEVEVPTWADVPAAIDALVEHTGEADLAEGYVVHVSEARPA